MGRNEKNDPDLCRFLKRNHQKLTLGRTYLIQYFIDHESKLLSLAEIQSFMRKKLPEINRSSIYRNLERLNRLKIIREVTLSNRSKRYQFAFDQPLSRFLFCCKSCGGSLRHLLRILPQLSTTRALFLRFHFPCGLIYITTEIAASSNT